MDIGNRSGIWHVHYGLQVHSNNNINCKDNSCNDAKDAQKLPPYDHNINNPAMPTSQLPVEILDLAFRQLSPGGLSAVARANKAFCDIAGRILYRSIEDSKPSRSIKILKSLFHRPSNATLVRVLDLDWSYCDFRLTGNFFRLLHNVLKNLTSLTSLSLDFSRSACLHTSFSWILDDCSFSLTFFAISIPCDAQLIHFLQNQPGITELHLRGLESTFPLDQPLPPTCLPNLTSFRSINASASVLAELVNGRPIRGVSISLHESSISECLDALSLSTRPMKTLTLITFDVKMPNLLFAEVSKRMPHLEALHIIVIHSQCTMVRFDFCAVILS